MDSILTSIKLMLGITEEYTHFDSQIIMHINSALMVLTQLGVGPSDGFMIYDAASTWDEFIPETKLEMAKTYVYLKVRLSFDPPEGSASIEAMRRMVEEYEWRLNIQAENIIENEGK